MSLTDTKLFLRVDGDTENALISRCITAARRAAELHTRRSFLTQSWKLAFDDYAPARVTLLRGPVQAIVSVKLIARDATETLVSSSTYYLSGGKDTVIFNTPLLGNVVEVTYSAGYGDAAALPEELKQGMLAHIAALYEQRTGLAPLPPASIMLYEPYRVVRV